MNMPDDLKKKVEDAAKNAPDKNIEEGKMCCEACGYSAMQDSVRVACERWFARGAQFMYELMQREADVEAWFCKQMSDDYEKQINQLRAEKLELLDALENELVYATGEFAKKVLRKHKPGNDKGDEK